MAKKATDKTPLTFNWEGKDKSGNPTKGAINADSIAEAKAMLRKQGIMPKKVRKQTYSMFSNHNKSITPLDIALFTRQTATMLKSGVPLLQGFDIVANGIEKAKMKKVIYDLKSDVSGGTSFAKALERHPKYFDDLYCNLVQAGENSGSLETMLERIALYKEKIETLKKKIKKALTYPIAVIVIGLVVSAILLIKVVPQFESVFSSFGADLPAFTLFVVGLSKVAQDWWFIAIVAIALAGFAFSKAHEKSRGFREWLDKAVLKLPIIGQILHNSAIARFARTLATTFAAGVPLVEALDSAAGASGNIVYEKAIQQVKNGVSTGQSLQNAVTMTGLFPPMATQMIAIGEEAGSLDMMLDKVASYYEEEVDNAVDNLSTLIEPLIMSILGILVGGLVIAMYLPIFQLGNVV
ncbi:type II secretion system F family protein [Amphritea sp. 1_MG-2023]|uniref:type II secretion system F family protein n=1 Tax=Amphritea sp. 1_MG-2023 TaxID=3062670 RepID=UPI0026E3D26F|nr:type II secretion system F family protein [Amphritea sp. 1_MG-2023]MDO6562900.1 type II secretion system F family protein [Amphritea sp. 1_MG-2023]